MHRAAEVDQLYGPHFLSTLLITPVLLLLLHVKTSEEIKSATELMVCLTDCVLLSEGHTCLLYVMFTTL